MAPKPRDLNPSGLGRAIINRKAKDARKMHESGLFVTDIDSTTRLKSVTQERDLDEFLNTAQLAGTEFTAERRNVKIIQSSTGSTHNPYLLSEQEEKTTLQKHKEHKQRLRVPRRPPWTKGMTTAQLERQEKDAFLDWRRGLAELQEQEHFLLTPFERNLEVWRQLWRVLERSHLVVQIVDARNPLRFRCEDLEAYVNDVEGTEGESGTGKGKRRCLLLINKADLLTAKQRCLWADYFDEQGVQYAFFSAANAAALQQERRDAMARSEAEHDHAEDEGEGNKKEEEEATPASLKSQSSEQQQDDSDEADDTDDESRSETTSEGDDSHEDIAYFSAEEDTPDGQDSRAKVLSVLELEDLFVKVAPDLSVFTDATGKPPSRLVVGLVGYPNVGKSSTINSLLGEKKVSVSSTPGKTKHFQTIHLSETMVLCDCPGLVFPQFATTKADLVCDGVLPIDQMREHTGPTALVVKRIPREVLEATYGLTVKVRGIEEGGDGKITAENFLIAYAIARGYMRSGQGNPDEARSARYVLKDYVNAKILFSHPPPGISEALFNQRTHELAMLRAAGKKRAPVTRVGKGADTFVPSNVPPVRAEGSVLPAQGQGLKSRALDHEFFESGATLSARPFIQGSIRNGKEFTRAKMFPHQNSVADDGTPLGGGRTYLDNSGGVGREKKHHKKTKRVKQRSGKGITTNCSVQRPSSMEQSHNSMPLRSSSSICAKLVTTSKQGRREAVVLSINKPVTIGRNPELCSYVIPDIFVSNLHCKLYAVRSGTGSVIVSCQDLSTNGLILNGHLIRKTSVILMDGDTLEIPSSLTFKCIHVWKESVEKTNIFDPTPPHQPAHKRIGGFIVTSHCLGSGSFATVHLAVDTSAHRQVACKSIRAKKGHELGQVWKEVKILMALNHPNINRVYEVEHNGKFLHIFLQLCTGGDLFTYITSHTETENRLCEGEAKYIMYQLLKGLMYLHDKMISHRDLKPENLLLYSPGPYPRIQIADFGLARPKAYQETLNVCGTVSYLPPEGILALDNQHLGYVGMPADCWSAGVILFVMLSGFHPFDCEPMFQSSSDWLSCVEDSKEFNDSQFSQNYVRSENKLKRRIIDGNVEFRDSVWTHLPNAKALVGRLLIHNHLHRATVYSALQSAWITADLTELEHAYQDRILSS